MDDEEEVPDPGEVKRVWIRTIHLVETYGGTFGAMLFDEFGNEIAQTPYVPEAEDWGHAAILFMIAAREVALKSGNADNN